jgi:uncharacterized protein YjeT (DUF2065 family)
VTGASGPWDLLFAALALVLVIEGVLPFFNPALWRRMFERVLQMTDGQIRFAGLSSIVVGVALLLLFWI